MERRGGVQKLLVSSARLASSTTHVQACGEPLVASVLHAELGNVCIPHDVVQARRVPILGGGVTSGYFHR